MTTSYHRPLFFTAAGVLGFAAIFYAVHLRMLPPTFGADGTTPTPPATIDSPMLLSMLGGGGIVSWLWGVLSKNWGSVQQASQVLHAVVPEIPAIPNVQISDKIASDTEELALATVGYLTNKTDVNAKRRFFIASVTELSDCVGVENPQAADALSSLGQAVISKWLPSPAQAAK